MIKQFIKNSSTIRVPKMDRSADLPKLPLTQSCTNILNTFKPSKYATTKDFYAHHEKPRYMKNELPASSSDIKGIDASAYRWFNRKRMNTKMPKIYQDKFIQVTFYPHYHFLSAARKSNIAIASFNTSLPILNDQALEKSIIQYKGRYKSHNFFQERLNPFTTAVGRSMFRKMFKNWLIAALKDKNVNDFRGIYFVKLIKLPITDQDKKSVEEGMKKMTLPKNLRSICKGYKGQLDLKPYNTYNEWVLPLSHIKTPFRK